MVRVRLSLKEGKSWAVDNAEALALRITKYGSLDTDVAVWHLLASHFV